MHTPVVQTGAIGSSGMDSITPKHDNVPRRNREINRFIQTGSPSGQAGSRPYWKRSGG